MTIAELHLEMRKERELWLEDRTRQCKARVAFERWFRACCAAGRPPDTLERYIPDELERFMSKTLQGPDGHVYWQGGERFKTNEHLGIAPRRWWWQHLNGSITGRMKFVPYCGDDRCIHPHHQEVLSWTTNVATFREEQLIGALQAMAGQLGRTPSRVEFDAAKPGGVSSSMLMWKFGSYTAALRAAGLTSKERRHVQSLSDEMMVEALQRVASELGRTPTCWWWQSNVSTPSDSSIRRRFGGWPSALRAAGLA